VSGEERADSTSGLGRVYNNNMTTPSLLIPHLPPPLPDYNDNSYDKSSRQKEQPRSIIGIHEATNHFLSTK
jgi:hypothetical protein